MRTPSAVDAVLYAKHLGRMVEFYERVRHVPAEHAGATHAVLPLGGGRLVLHAIPGEFAASIRPTDPPELREDAAVKLSFVVGSLETVRRDAAAGGGGVMPSERAWESGGLWHLDGWDPEGNMIQFRAPL